VIKMEEITIIAIALFVLGFMSFLYLPLGYSCKYVFLGVLRNHFASLACSPSGYFERYSSAE
jgi:hypothetical protein